MSQLVGKSAEDRNAASVMLDILAGSKKKTAAEVVAEVVTDAAKVSGPKVLYAVLAANTAGRARMIVREDNTKNGVWAWARLRERFGRESGATSFTEVFQYGWPSEKPFEDVWRDWVKKVSKLPSGSLSSQAIEQLTISGLTRHGQPELQNHLRLRAPLAWQDIQTQVEKISLHNLSSTLTTTNGHQCCVDRCKMPELWNPDASETDCWYKDATCKTCGKQGHLAKVCRSGNTQTSRQGAPRAKGSGKGSGKGKGRAKNRTPETCLCCGMKGHKNSECRFKTATCSNCGKVGHLRAVRRNTNTHEIDNDDEPCPEVTVKAVWCMAVQDTVENDHCNQSEKHEGSSEHRDGLSCGKFTTNIETGQNSEKVITNVETGQNFEKVVPKIEMGALD